MPAPRGRSLSSVRDLDHALSLLEEPQSRRECLLEDALEPGVRRVSASHPEDLRGWPVLIEQPDEVTILGDDDRPGGSSRGKNLPVLGVAKPEVADRARLHPEGFSNPCGENR